MADVVRARLSKESVIEQIAKASLPTRKAGEFTAYCFRSHIDGAEHLALVKGTLDESDAQGQPKPVLARVQAEERIADILGTRDLLTRQRMTSALERIAEEGRGVFVYVRHPSKSSLSEMRKNIRPAPGGGPAVTAQLREYGIGAQILRYLGAKRIRLLSNSSRDLAGIQAFQIDIVEQVGF